MYDKMISTEAQEILGELRKHCPELLTPSFCTNDCQACLQYIKTRTRIREDLQQQLLESSIAAMHSEYEQRDNWICERCEAVRSVEWYDDTMYLLQKRVLRNLRVHHKKACTASAPNAVKRVNQLKNRIHICLEMTSMLYA